MGEDFAYEQVERWASSSESFNKYLKGDQLRGDFLTPKRENI